jgi:gamma-glutamyltranspeptidase
MPATLRVEKVAPLDPTLQDALRARGHHIEPIDNIAHVQAIQIEGTPQRRLFASSDPRKGGQPAGH